MARRSPAAGPRRAEDAGRRPSWARRSSNASSITCSAESKAYADAAGAWDEYDKLLGLGQKDKKNRSWDVAKNRKAGAAAIRKAMEHEKAAVAELKKALVVVGGK